MTPVQPQDVLDFWFGEPDSADYGQSRPQWFQKSDVFDQQIRTLFQPAVKAGLKGELDHWQTDDAPVEHALAFIVLLDQFPRNIYRNSPGMIAGDERALNAAQRLVGAGRDQQVLPIQRIFVYLPYEHSESLAIQEQSLQLIGSLKEDEQAGGFAEYAQRHYDIVARFGRFPHRNAWLGRESTAEELEFLKQPGSGF